MDRRQKQEALAKELRDRASSFEVKTFLELLALQLESTKNNLLTCKSEDFHRLQGEAQTYQKLIQVLTRQNISSGK